MAINKVIYGGKTLIDLTSDTITPEDLREGVTAHGKDGVQIVGSSTLDVDSGDATVSVAEILKGKTAYARGSKITGTMPNNGSAKGELTTKEEAYTIAQGYHDGSGKVAINAVEKEKIIPANIRQGVTILGVIGEMSGSESVKAQAKEATPSSIQQTVLPDKGYTHLSQVVVKPIPYVESDNSAQGTTVTIG